MIPFLPKFFGEEPDQTQLDLRQSRIKGRQKSRAAQP